MGQIGDIGSSLGNGLSSLGQAFTNSNTFAPDPSGFSGSEWAARFLGAGAKGLGQGIQNMQQQNAQMRQGGGGQIQPPPTMQPQVDLSATIGNGGGGRNNTAADQANPYARRAQNPFYGGYNPG